MESEIDHNNKVQSLVAPPTVIGDYTLRPFTAGSLIMLQMVKNPLVDQTVSTDDLFFHIASFIYIHTEDRTIVQKAVINLDTFREKVIDFADGLKVTDIIAAANQIREIIERAATALNYEVEGNEKEADPNS